ncbi:MAG: DNA repair protein RecN [Bacteroidetes bacterium]|jgi:DNA repair protein RecN (Recombination protein N)|nr:DNA repair protein RecN [Bacteroidota bacterium]
MITHLNIKNYALIKDLDIEFQDGFTSITGETGAGKSILLGAIGLIMGERSDSSAILDPSQKCILEASFDLSKLQLQSDFEEKDIDFNNHCTVRREWSPNGKTRSFINESQVTVSELKWLGQQLLEIHSQHTGLLVTQSNEQLKLLDAYCNCADLLKDYQITFYEHQNVAIELKAASEKLSKITQDTEYNGFLRSELEEFNPKINEENDLENDIALLSQATDLEDLFAKIDLAMDGAENSIVDQLNTVKAEMKGFSTINADLGGIYERFNSLAVDAKELARDLRSVANGIESNPEKLHQANERYSQLQLLFRKHNVNSSEELLQKLTSLQTEQEGETLLQEKINELQEKVKFLQTQRENKANALHKQRNSGIEKLCSEVVDQLIQLEMPFAQMQIQLTQTQSSFTETGNTQIAMLFCANKGQSPMPIEKVASGGEISRLNFCLRTLIADLKQLPTLIYDEADTGVSGEVANRLGYLMRKQGQKQQILAITHLPQVAAAGNQQLFVYKDNQAAISETKIKTLDSEGRINALAEMLSGKNPSEAAKLNARDLLNI